MFLTAELLRCTGVMYFPSFSPGRFWQLLPLSLAYMVHAMLVLRSLLYLNVAVYNTLKRMTPVLVLLFKVKVKPMQHLTGPGKAVPTTSSWVCLGSGSSNNCLCSLVRHISIV